MTTQTIASEADNLRNAKIIARLERLPVTRRLTLIRIIIGSATFFDAYTVIVIAYAMPQLTDQWNISLGMVGIILSAGYLGQLFGAIGFGSLAERIGRLPTLLITILLFVTMDICCLFAWGGWSMAIFRFFQGVGTGGEVPVASAYINEFIGAKKRGRFFLLYELIFPIGLMFAGMAAFVLLPLFSWRILFVVGLVPAILMIPMRIVMPESPRWLASKGKFEKADKVVSMLEREATKEGKELPQPEPPEVDLATMKKGHWRELFRGIYLRRTLMIWVLWVSSYFINNGMMTWFSTLYKTQFGLEGNTPQFYSWITSAVAVVASIICALYIDKIGRKRWYSWAFFLACVPLLTLGLLGARTALQVLILGSLTYAIIQTITFSLYLYSAELYPTRLRAVGTGFGSAWLRVASTLAPNIVAFLVAGVGLGSVFLVFAGAAVIGGITVALFGIETKGAVLEKLSP